MERERHCLVGKSVALLFEKPSLRTRVTFELAVRQLGGHCVVLTQGEVGMGRREAVKDVAHCLDRWVNALVVRVYRHATLEEMADQARIPVINALSDLEHPCQALADLFTLRERWGTFRGHRLVFIGDGFNVAHSLMLLCALVGLDCVVATPRGYEPRAEIIKRAYQLAERSGAYLEVLNDPREAVRRAEVVYTDVWVSMGQEGEAERRRRDFASFQVNPDLLSYSPKEVFVMHCLPAHRGEEITDEVLDSPNSLAWDQAENRLYVQKALLAGLVGGLLG